MKRDRAPVGHAAEPREAPGAVGRFGGVVLAAVALLAAASLANLATRATTAVAELPPAYETLPLPSGLDSITPLQEVEARLAPCSSDCATILYLWTPRMPLSRSGIPEVVVAAERLDLPVVLVSREELAAYAAADAWSGPAPSAVADAALAAGALAHAPSLVLLGGREPDGRVEPVGTAVLGYKTAAAYEAALARRLGQATGGARPSDDPLEPAAAAPLRVARAVDYPVIGVPGAYFRWVPGRNAIAYESGQRVYLLDLDDGESRLAPGFIDFVPTPDGRYFVTPGEVDGGLTFYDAEQVFDAVERGVPGEVEPIFTDLRMRDQYPSVGILEQDATRTVYRVLTSWFEGVVYRDYDVRVDPRSGSSSVQPVGEVIRPCADVALSTPIMSQDGLEVAGRDEASGTTKIFRILEAGRCEPLTDFGVQTTKVAWHASGRRIAFAVPRRRRGGEEAEQGIFVLDRDARALTRLPTSEGASRLAFPDFVGDDRVVFLVPGGGGQPRSFFRVVPLEE